MPEKYEVTYRSKGKDIQLPVERKKDPRLQSTGDKVRGSIQALRGIAGKIQKDADEYKRQQR